jgi:saccharopine dehydrogenase (NAD+, L-lysine-forming)
MVNDGRFLIYGATGYTGRLTAALARSRGLSPILAGRSRGSVERLGAELGFETRVFDLRDGEEVRRGLAGVRAVLHDAGPFSATSAPMVDACLATGAHYLDITGEIEVFEAVLARNDEAKHANVCLIPGVGFDVVPTDCLAAMVHERLPSATHLEIAFAGLGSSSQGTLKTSVERLAVGGAARIDGELVTVPFGWKTREVTFPHGARRVVSLPWGDLSTAYHTTGIPNIVVYTRMPKGLVRSLPFINRLRPMFRLGAVQSFAKWIVDRRAPGPSDALREKGWSDFWAEARDADGRTHSMSMTGPEGYTLTADASLRAVARVLEGNVAPGALTPARAFGSGFILECDGMRIE